jgi:peptidoglycan/LPS O-acetylase OafA/YrhL
MKNRATHLDGLRGIAATAVALMHFFRSFDNAQLSSQNPINYTPLSVFWNGHFAVAVFFVMSGFLFFRKFHGADAQACVRGAIKRYFRLSVPILVLSLIAFGLHQGGQMSNVQAAATSGSDWLVKWYRFTPDLKLAVLEPLYSAYVGFDAAYSYNTNLWTISYELFAVFTIIALAWGCGRLSRTTQAVLICLGLGLSLGTHYFEFLLGALLAFKLRPRPIEIRLPIALAGLTLALIAARSFQGSLPREISVNYIYPIAGAVLIAVVETCPSLRRWFSTTWLRWLGRISFGLYLVHFVILSSVASTTWIASSSVLLTFAIFSLATIGGALLFYALVDRPWLTFIDKVFDPKRRNPPPPQTS